MADQALAPSEDMQETMMRLRAAAALGLQLHEGLSQAAACARVEIDPKTYRKYIRGSDELMTIREATEAALIQGAVLSLKAYLAGLERMEALIADPNTAPRDFIAAMKVLEANLIRFVGVLPQSQVKVEAAPTTPFNFDGPVTIRVEQQRSPAIIDSARQPTDED